MSDVSMAETQTAEAPISEGSMESEMAAVHDRLNPPDELAKVPNEAQVAAGHDYSVEETPETESTEAPQEQIDGVKAPASLSPTMQQQWGGNPPRNAGMDRAA
jgi:hypothetical protein